MERYEYEIGSGKAAKKRQWSDDPFLSQSEILRVGTPASSCILHNAELESQNGQMPLAVQTIFDPHQSFKPIALCFRHNASQSVLLWVRTNLTVVLCCYFAFQRSFAHAPPFFTNIISREWMRMVSWTHFQILPAQRRCSQWRIDQPTSGFARFHVKSHFII